MPFIQPAQLERALPEWKQTKKNTTKQLCRDQTQLAKVNNVHQQGNPKKIQIRKCIEIRL